MAPVSQSHARAEWFGGCHRGAIVRNRAFPNYSFSDADPGEWFANDDILGVRPPAWSLCSIGDPPERASRSREHGRANVHPEGNGYPELRSAAVSGERSVGRQTLGDVANASGACRIIRGMSHCFRKLLIIANPVAQNGEGKACAYRARALLASALGEDAFALEFTERPGQASDIAARAASRGFDCVCALGGDGIANEVACGLMEVPAGERPAFALLPVGSGNDYARTLGMFNRPSHGGLAAVRWRIALA